MAKISDLEAASMALVSAQKEKKVGKIRLRMDYTSTPGTVICNIKDSVGSISIHGATEIKELINELERLLGDH
jgi:multisubunit Na+/H+ antiporter MnhE subunit